MIKWSSFDFSVLFSLTSFKVMESQDFVKIESVFLVIQEKIYPVVFVRKGFVDSLFVS